MQGWTTGQWLSIVFIMCVGCMGTATAVMLALRHRSLGQMLVFAKDQLTQNTAQTEQSLIQLQNNNRVVAQAEATMTQAEAKMIRHAAELQQLVVTLQEQNVELMTRMQQARHLLAEVQAMNVTLRTEERQHHFEERLNQLVGLITAQSLALRPEEPTP